jgi:dCMP deaminase
MTSGIDLYYNTRYSCRLCGAPLTYSVYYIPDTNDPNDPNKLLFNPTYIMVCSTCYHAQYTTLKQTITDNTNPTKQTIENTVVKCVICNTEMDRWWCVTYGIKDKKFGPVCLYCREKPEVLEQIEEFFKEKSKNKRPSWNSYFMKIAEDVSTRATCDRAQCGCILVKDHRILSTGYNGSMPGEEHCDEIGHLMVEGHCTRTIHSEINAINQAAKFGIAVNGATAYLTQFPCWNCFKSLLSAGISKIYYKGEYRKTDSDQYPYNMNILEKFDGK